MGTYRFKKLDLLEIEELCFRRHVNQKCICGV